MRPAPHLTIPQPCSESWAAMTPTAQGRHCAACAKTVIDFTRLSDAEILEQLARPGNGCGRFRTGQLGRPLQPVALAPARGWRAWLAALATVWGLREMVAPAATAQTLTAQQRPETQSPENLQARRRDDYEGVAPVPATVLRGVVVDASTGEALPYVSVIIHGTTSGTPTNAAGEFELPIPAEKLAAETLLIDFKYLGYLTQTRTVQDFAAGPLRVGLMVDTHVLGGYELIVAPPRKLPPAPWHPRRFYYWGKYWLTRPFR